MSSLLAVLIGRRCQRLCGVVPWHQLALLVAEFLVLLTPQLLKAHYPYCSGAWIGLYVVQVWPHRLPPRHPR
jgi:hypothetical protein